MSSRRAGRVAFVIGSFGLLALGVSSALYIDSRANTVRSESQGSVHTLVITAQIRQQPVSNALVFRGNVTLGNLTSIPGPTTSAPEQVVTAVDLRGGQAVSDGSLVGSVDLEPVFVMEGSVPSFRVMGVGDHGIDIAELQDGLHAAGFSTSPDLSGVYSSGTAEAVSRLFARFGYVPPMNPVTLPNGTEGSKLAPSVGLGEVDFVSKLPARTISVASLGQNLTTGNAPLAMISPSTLHIVGQLDTPDAQTLHPGEPATATSDITGQSWPLSILGVSGIGSGQSGDNVTMMFMSDSVPLSLLGQNLRINVGGTTQSKVVLTVPISAIYAGADGENFVNLLIQGSLKSIPVTVGTDSGGTVAISGKGYALKPGDRVQVGTATQLAGS